MSRLLDLLSRVGHKRKRKAVSPQLEEVYKQRDTGNKRYSVVILVAAFLVFSGVALVYITKKLDLGENVSTHKTAQPSRIVQKNSQSLKLVSRNSHDVSQISIKKAPSPASPVKQIEKQIEATDSNRAENGNRKKLKKLTEASKNPSPPASPSVDVEKQTILHKRNVLMKNDTEKTGSYIRDHNLKYLYNRAHYLEREGRFQDAIDVYLQILKRSRGDYRVLNNLAYLYIRIGGYGEAETFARKALSSNKKYVPAILNLAIVLSEKGNKKEAEALLKEALSIEPRNRGVLYNLALLYEKEGLYDQALSIYSRLNQGNSEYKWYAIMGKARIEEIRGHPKLAIKYYRKVTSSTSAPESLKDSARGRIIELVEVLPRKE